LFINHSAGIGINMCLAGMVAAIKITSLLGMSMLRSAFVTSVCRLTMLHAPAQMQVKNAKAFRALLVVADENGDHLHVSLSPTLFEIVCFRGGGELKTLSDRGEIPLV